MGQGKPTAVFMQEHEGWTADGIRGRAETCGNASDKHSFACSQGTRLCCDSPPSISERWRGPTDQCAATRAATGARPGSLAGWFKRPSRLGLP